jgi:hypothetical protein
MSNNTVVGRMAMASGFDQSFPFIGRNFASRIRKAIGRNQA